MGGIFEDDSGSGGVGGRVIALCDVMQDEELHMTFV